MNSVESFTVVVRSIFHIYFSSLKFAVIKKSFVTLNAIFFSMIQCKYFCKTYSLHRNMSVVSYDCASRNANEIAD